MIYAHCETCGELVYRYSPNTPKAGQMGNDQQDCWHQHLGPDSDGHLPTWPKS